MNLRWATTVPNPYGKGYGVDGDQRGWKLHIVDTEALTQIHTSRGEVVRGPAICGLRAKHGWGLDLFIEDECKRCVARATKLGLTIPEPD